jgi:Fe-S cluster assembly iron-binding protein IscA
VLTLTESAKDVVREMVAGEDAPEGGGVRITTESVSENETSLALAVAEAPAAGDEVVDEDGVRVFLEPEAASLLEDQVLDAERHEDHVHFVVEPQSGAELNGAGGMH